MIKDWIFGLIRFRGKMLAAAAFGVALAVSLLAVLALFVAQSASTMTARAISAVAPDWQVQLVGTADIDQAQTAITETVPVTALQIVDYADVKAFTAHTGGTVQSTGAGKAVGIASGYAKNFPSQIRLLAGSLDGVLVAQQTAANLHANPGDTIQIDRLAEPPVEVIIAGVVELPGADQFFQIIGATPQAAPVAPPDNVILLPQAQWQQVFGTQLTPCRKRLLANCTQALTIPRSQPIQLTPWLMPRDLPTACWPNWQAKG